MVLALIHHGHDVGVQVGESLVLGAHQVERTAHLQLRAGGAVLAKRVYLRRLLDGHQHRHRCGGVLLVGGERDPPVAVVQALADAVPDGLAHHLHGLVVVVCIGVAERRDGGVVDERAVGTLLGVHQVLVVVRERRAWHERRRQRPSQHERGKGAAQPPKGFTVEETCLTAVRRTATASPLAFGAPRPAGALPCLVGRPHHSTSPVRICGARRRGLNDTNISTISASSVTNSRRPAHICTI